MECFDWEYCASFPFIKCYVKRNLSLTLEYKDIDMKEQVEEFSGFKARVI
jgi:peptide deformylase